MLIRLSKADMHESRMLAVDTVALLEHMGKGPRLENPRQERVNANWWGFMAEFAVCRVFGLELPRLNVATDGGVDLWLGDISVDVKFSQTNKLIFDSEEKFRANVALLVVPGGEADVLELAGWIGRTAFLENCGKHDFGYGERLVMDADNLNEVCRLWHRITERKYL